MAKLAIFIHQRDIFADGSTALFPCTITEAHNLSWHVGSPVLMANVGEPFGQGFIALAKLERFTRDGEDYSAEVSSIRNFPDVAAFRQENPADPGLFEVSDATFHDVIGMVTGSEFDEASTQFWSGTWTEPGTNRS